MYIFGQLIEGEINLYTVRGVNCRSGIKHRCSYDSQPPSILITSPASTDLERVNADVCLSKGV